MIMSFTVSKEYLISVLSLAIFLSMGGCMGMNSASSSDANGFEAGTGSMRESRKRYILQAGDVIDIKFFYNPDLNEKVTIRPDGRISLQLIDEIEAAGLTPVQLDELLSERYSNILRQSEIAVIVKEFVGQKVYVGGEINKPGLIPIKGKLSALQAIFQTGGFKDTAELKNVVVLRGRHSDAPLFLTLNLRDHLSDREVNDIFLKPYDIVFVPKSGIAKLDQFVDQYIDKLIPISMNVGFNWVYDLNPN